MESVVQQLKTINSVIGELKEDVRALKDNVEDRLKQLESNVNKLEAKINIKTDEIPKEIDSLRSEKLNNNDEGVSRQLDIEKMKAIEMTAKENKEKIQSIESLSTEMFERILHNESSLKLKMEQISKTMASMTLRGKSLDVQAFEGSNHQKTETYEWTITDVNNRFQLENSELFQSPVFTFLGYGFDIQAKIQNEEGKFEILLQFKGSSETNELASKDRFTVVTYIVKDQINTREKKDIVYKVPLTFNHRFGTEDWIFGKLLPNAILTSPYTKDNCIKIMMLFEPPSIDRSFVSNNGVLMWTVDNYKKRKQEQLHSLIWSPSFYTSPRGYRVRIRLSIDDEGPMALGVHFLTGEHDANLPLDFPHKTTVTLFNHTDPSRNLVKSNEHHRTGFKTIQMESCQLTEHNGFIKDDSFLLKVVIEPLAKQL